MKLDQYIQQNREQVFWERSFFEFSGEDVAYHATNTNFSSLIDEKGWQLNTNTIAFNDVECVYQKAIDIDLTASDFSQIPSPLGFLKMNLEKIKCRQSHAYFSTILESSLCYLNGYGEVISNMLKVAEKILGIEEDHAITEIKNRYKKGKKVVYAVKNFWGGKNDPNYLAEIDVPQDYILKKVEEPKQGINQEIVKLNNQEIDEIKYIYDLVYDT